MMRRYQSTASQFSQPDPYDGSYSLSDPQSLNRYAYVQNDPVNFVDPSGLQMRPCGINEFGEDIYCTTTADDLADRLFGIHSRFGGYNSDRQGGSVPQNPAATEHPPVDKGYGWWGPCNRSASDLMATVRRDFSKFGNYGELAAEGNAVGFIKFTPGPITQGRVIPITVGAVSTAAPSDYYSRNVSVTVSSATSTSFTFTTNPDTSSNRER